MISPALRRLRDALDTALCNKPLYSKRLPLTLPSRSNTPGSWRKHADRYAAQRAAGRLAVHGFARDGFRLLDERQWGVAVRIVREAPRPLDDDNLAAACKSFRDGIADALGVDDRDPRVVWVVDQAKSKVPSVLVEVYAMEVTT